MNIESFGQMKQVGRSVLQEIRSKLNGYLTLAEIAPKTGSHLSEYTGHQMLGAITRYVLDQYFASMASGKIDAEHGYDDNMITYEIKSELRKAMRAAQVEIVPTGTAANLCLISSFTSAYGQELKFIACETEHTIILEGGMLQKAGIQQHNIIRFPARNRGDGIIDLEIIKQVLPKNGKFIFQMAIPSNEGVVPTIDELHTMIRLVKNHGGIFLVDGARITNALVHWGKDLNFFSGIRNRRCHIRNKQKRWNCRSCRYS